MTTPSDHTYVNPKNHTERLTVFDMFGARFDEGVLELEYLLNTHRMKQFYRRDFLYLSQMLYAIERYRMLALVDGARLDMVEASLAKSLDALRDLLRKGLSECNALLQVNGHADKNLHYHKPVTLIVPIISPFAREYMEILVLADETFGKLATCHLLGLVTTPKKVERENLYRKGIRAYASTIRLRRIQLAKYIRQVREGSDEEAKRLIDEAVGREIRSLVMQGKEEPDSKGAVSDEADLERMASDSITSAAEAAVEAAPAVAELPAEAAAVAG